MATMLEQQQLLEPAPPRRLIVAQGHLSHWGVDPSSRRVAIGGVDRQGDRLHRWVQTFPFAKVDGAQRLSEIYTVTRRSTAETAAEHPAPGVVWVEQPSGANLKLPLYYAVGVMMAAIWDGLYEATGRPVHIETPAPAHWKLVAAGRGNIYKPKSGDPSEYGVLTWARLNGYQGSSWDEADAWGLAEAARREIALEPR
jgi:hypothetical protein